MRVVVHWRHRHVTEERLLALREVLEARPGSDEVVVLLTGTGDRLLLPLTVDAGAGDLRQAIGRATEACAVVEGLEDAFA